MVRGHIHRYTLRFKTIKAKEEEDRHQIIQDTLQKFLDIVLQADPKTIIPPYLELDRSDKTVSDLSNLFTVSSIDSHYVLKKYFFRLSPRDEAGVSWCSIILAQSLPFQVFMKRAQSSLSNHDFSLWPKPSDNENASNVGWLLYSTRAQDEERIAQLFSKAKKENIGIKWKPIRTTAGEHKRKESGNPNEKIYALHIECATDRLHKVRKKLSVWYSSQSTEFLDGTKMRLVPTFASVLSSNNKIKLSSCLARQAALAAGLATASTWEMSTNLLLDKKRPKYLENL